MLTESDQLKTKAFHTNNAQKLLFIFVITEKEIIFKNIVHNVTQEQRGGKH